MTLGPADGKATGSRRERLRAATLEELKQAALGLIKEHGSAGLRFADIARSIGVTAPALYRYYADRDELLTALVADSYDSLASALAASRGTAPAADPAGTFFAACTAYREWTQRNPERFALIFGAPVPGYAPPPDGPTAVAGRRVMDYLTEVLAEAAVLGRLGDSPVPQAEEAILLAWATVHGFVSLEAYGHFDRLGQEDRNRLFATQTSLAARVAGLVLTDRVPEDR